MAGANSLLLSSSLPRRDAFGHLRVLNQYTELLEKALPLCSALGCCPVDRRIAQLIHQGLSCVRFPFLCRLQPAGSVYQGRLILTLSARLLYRS